MHLFTPFQLYGLVDPGENCLVQLISVTIEVDFGYENTDSDKIDSFIATHNLVFFCAYTCALVCLLTFVYSTIFSLTFAFIAHSALCFFMP